MLTFRDLGNSFSKVHFSSFPTEKELEIVGSVRIIFADFSALNFHKD
ncbi:hypothetical protein HQN83_03755 [Pedobacter sp. LMG 31643]|nr:hypothetical protein [Pedobacter foliorum]NRF37814.1 hypothetical protein [Pedobacter foliorum]